MSARLADRQLSQVVLDALQLVAGGRWAMYRNFCCRRRQEKKEREGKEREGITQTHKRLYLSYMWNDHLGPISTKIGRVEGPLT